MATNYTTNYQLCQWEANDKVLRSDFNADNQKIDAALKAKGNCILYWGSYTGTGEYGPSHPNTLTFDFYPKMIILDVQVNHHYNGTPENYILCEGRTAFPAAGSSSSNTLTWGEKSVSWYFDSGSSSQADRQFNVKGQVYHYLALGVQTEE